MIQLHVWRECALGKVWPGRIMNFSPLGVNIRGPNPVNGDFPVFGRDLRPATLEDFDRFRVYAKGFLKNG